MEPSIDYGKRHKLHGRTYPALPKNNNLDNPRKGGDNSPRRRRGSLEIFLINCLNFIYDPKEWIFDRRANRKAE